MAYIGADDVKRIREALKARFPKFKFGCRKGSGSLSVDVTIKAGPTDFDGRLPLKVLISSLALCSTRFRTCGLGNVPMFMLRSGFNGT